MDLLSKNRQVVLVGMRQMRYTKRREKISDPASTCNTCLCVLRKYARGWPARLSPLKPYHMNVCVFCVCDVRSLTLAEFRFRRYDSFVWFPQDRSMVTLNGPLCDNLYKPMNKKAPRVEYPTHVRLGEITVLSPPHLGREEVMAKILPCLWACMVADALTSFALERKWVLALELRIARPEKRGGIMVYIFVEFWNWLPVD